MATVTCDSRMRDLIRKARALASDCNGATAIEYAMIASGISIAIVTVVTSLGSAVSNLFSSVQTNLE